MGESAAERRKVVNNGIINMDSAHMTFTAPVLFQQPATSSSEANAYDPHKAPAARYWDLGVITVLAEEASAVTRLLAQDRAYRITERDSRLRFEESTIATGGQVLRVVSTRALKSGPESASNAFDILWHLYRPAVVVMVGIAGAIHPSLRLGDVIIALEVINYDQRKETQAGTRHRGTTFQAPAAIRRAVNNFFSDNGDPYQMHTDDPDGTTRASRVVAGAIGSGQAVVADNLSDIRTYLANFNEKTLGVDTETGGIAQAFYEKSENETRAGWLAIRGISDTADGAKDDRFHDIASWHAASLLQRLAPYLTPDSWPLAAGEGST
jgi:adenosylhomocysteine nucleosidase